MKFFVVLCVVLTLDGVLSAGVLKRDVSGKTKDDEDIYGSLDENEGEIQKDQVDYYEEEDDVEEPPADTGGSKAIDVNLVSKPLNVIKEIGAVVNLPCQASSKDVVRVWSKDLTPIYQDSIRLTAKSNYVLYNSTLKVTIESKEDYGAYSCKLALTDATQPEIVHHLVEAMSPNISFLDTNEHKRVFDIGDSLTLTCQATGTPKPRIAWHKSNEKLGTEGESLTIPNVKAKHAGMYRCLADNDVGRPDHQYIEIFVNHSPTVSIEKYLVNSDHESDAELVCEVKAFPYPVVNWQRNGQNIVNNEPKIKLQKERNNERNVLIIKNITESDFGQYSCVAINSLGKQERTINLVKTPVVRKFERNQSNDNVKDVILQWKVESKQPISMHELQYRRKGETDWNTITPEVSDANNDVYLIKQTLKNLEPGMYETRARSKNNHGWSDYSDIIPFIEDLAKHGSHHPKVKHTKKEQKDIKSPDSSHDTPAQHRSEGIMPVGESISSSTTHRSSLALIVLALLVFHVRQ